MYRYVINPNAIILSVTAANTDLANSDAIQMAREVDPEGDRTVGVLTKLDLMDPGTDASDMLMNRTIPLKRGYVGIVNRGQKDIGDGLSIRQAINKEEKFFKEHPAYRALQHRVGTSVLAKILNQVSLEFSCCFICLSPIICAVSLHWMLYWYCLPTCVFCEISRIRTTNYSSSSLLYIIIRYSSITFVTACLRSRQS